MKKARQQQTKPRVATRAAAPAAGDRWYQLMTVEGRLEIVQFEPKSVSLRVGSEFSEVDVPEPNRPDDLYADAVWLIRNRRDASLACLITRVGKAWDGDIQRAITDLLEQKIAAPSGRHRARPMEAAIDKLQALAVRKDFEAARERLAKAGAARATELAKDEVMASWKLNAEQLKYTLSLAAVSREKSKKRRTSTGKTRRN